MEIRGLKMAVVALTFAIPAMQWFASMLIPNLEFKGAVSSAAIILSVGLLFRKRKTAWFQTLTSQRKVICYFALTIVLGLLMTNVRNLPVAKITGQPRKPFEVFDLIVLLPIAEELIFRGVIWSKLERINPAPIVVLAGSSLLFGAAHLGYWAQTSWPLPPEAFFHSISMIFAGVFFGFFRFKSGSLTFPALLHMLANGAILLTQ